MKQISDDNITRMTDIHDIKPALNMGFDLQWLFWVLALLVLIGLGLLAWHLWRQRKSPAPVEPAPPPIPPEVEAYQALDALAARSGLSGKQFYFALSSIIRRYLERRYEFPAAEMTTEELVPWINRLGLDTELSVALKAFCRSTDPIKFAGAQSDREKMHDDLAFGRNVVKRTTIIEDEAADIASKVPDRKVAPGKAPGTSSELDPTL